MTDELATIDPSVKGFADQYAGTAVSTSTYFMAKKDTSGKLTSVLSDETKYPTEALETVAAGLYSTVGLLLKVFATYSTDEQLQRMGPTLASLVKTLHQKARFVGGNSLKGGADSDSDPLWDDAFSKGAQSGGNGSASSALVPAVPAPDLSAPGALAPAAAAAPGALMPPSIVDQAQAELIREQAAFVRAHRTAVEAGVGMGQERAELARQILKQANPLTSIARESRAVIYSVLAEGALVGLVYLGGKGVGGVGLISTIVLIQVYTAVSNFQVSKVLSGVGSAVGAGIFSVGTGIGGAVLNTISGMLGMGSVTETIELPSELIRSNEPSVLVEGRGFTPGVPLPPPPAEFPEIKALREIQNLAARIDFFTNRLMVTLFGEQTATDRTVYYCFGGVVFILLYYMIGHLIDIVDEVRTRRKVEIANAVEIRSTAPPPALPNVRSMLGLESAAAPTSRALMGGKKKRRTLRNRKAAKTRGKLTFVY